MQTQGQLNECYQYCYVAMFASVCIEFIVFLYLSLDKGGGQCHRNIG
jgi:hypothetical protein